MTWKKGESGNPEGGRLKESARLRAEAAKEMLPLLLERLFSLAMAGDVPAAKLLLDRLMPPLRPTAELVNVPLPNGSLTDKAKALLEAAAAGVLAPDVAAEFIAAVSRLVQVEQGDELRKKLEELESVRAAPGGITIATGVPKPEPIA